ncbi:MAG: hypothetical protein H7Y37_09385 [Anaerolineae bacterium]|nr:hypothetical protein [Gloeobacterales cyanobacterium ES-bin-313]
MEQDLVRQIAECLYEQLHKFHQTKPHLLRPHAQGLPFADPELAKKAISSFTQQFPTHFQADLWLTQILEILAVCFQPKYFATQEHMQFSRRILDLMMPVEVPVAEEEEVGNALLLLDVSHFALTNNELQFLESICYFPLTYKLALGDWRQLAQEQEHYFLEQDFALVHASTQEKLWLGCERPEVQEILMCSYGERQEKLCAYFSKQEMTVYRVFRMDNALVLHNQGSGSYRFFTDADAEEPEVVAPEPPPLPMPILPLQLQQNGEPLLFLPKPKAS